VRKKWPDTPDVHFKLGLIAMTRRDYPAAVEQMKAELARDPAHPLAWQFLGDALAKSGKPAEAIDALQRAVWLNGRSAKLFVMLGQIYLEQGQLSIAENSLSHALAIEPQNYEANFQLAKLYFKTNRPELAKQRMAIAEGLRKAAAAAK
jgi:Tfp pilus assembly protein PilF